MWQHTKQFWNNQESEYLKESLECAYLHDSVIQNIQ